MKVLQAIDLVALIQKALATNTPLAKTGWYRPSPMGFSPRGCCIVDEPRRGQTANCCTSQRAFGGWWLAQRDDVVAYCDASPVAGGAGAVLVLLRAAKG